MIGVSAGRLRAYLRAGVLSPEKGTRGELRFSFQDLLLLRKAEGLVSQRISPHRVRRALKALRERLTDEQPLTGMSLGTDGPQVVVHERGARWQAESGQVLLAFDKQEPEAAEAMLVALPTRADRRAAGERRRAPDGRGDLRARVRPRRSRPGARGIQLPPGDRAGAAPRRRAHQPGADPARARRARPAPRNTTGARWRSAPTTPTASFNLGVVLEDGGHHADALEAYRRAIATDDRNADAHYNAARLYDLLGDYAAALRHLRICRDLARKQR